MLYPRKKWPLWAVLLTGPILAVLVFVMTYFFDPLNLGEQTTLAALPAFLFSVVILLIIQSVTTYQEVDRLAAESDRLHEAVQSVLHVTKVGTPKTAWEYIMSRLPAVERVVNTSLNIPEEYDRISESLYEHDSYLRSPPEIADAVRRGLRWKDIGDPAALPRLRAVAASAAHGKHADRYEYRVIVHDEPQVTFTILTFSDGSREVLFNWDMRAAGQEPTVLLARDHDIVNMFAVQFDHLWRIAATDHDKMATRSTSKK